MSPPWIPLHNRTTCRVKPLTTISSTSPRDGDNDSDKHDNKENPSFIVTTSTLTNGYAIVHAENEPTKHGYDGNSQIHCCGDSAYNNGNVMSNNMQSETNDGYRKFHVTHGVTLFFSLRYDVDDKMTIEDSCEKPNRLRGPRLVANKQEHENA
ncbi:hypothetical protein ACA910_008483 [Epithemia clementina (nom. ined.)]